MKTITMDYDLYKSELAEEYERGSQERHKHLDRMLMAVYGKSFEVLEKAFDAHTKATEDQLLHNYVMRGFK